jgi:endoglucanase
MKNNLPKLALTAAIVLATIFIFSCSSDDSNDNQLPPATSSSGGSNGSSGGDGDVGGDGGSSSSGGGDVGGDGDSSSSGGGGSSSSVVDPRPSSPESMSAQTALQYFKSQGINVGINVGNSLDAVNNSIANETAWGNPKVNQAYITGIKNLGFKIIRIPVTWNGHIGAAPDYKIEEAYLRRVAEVVNMAKTAGLKAFINIHHDGNQDLGGWLDIDNVSTAMTEKYVKVWTQIAEYFKNYGDWLMFQGFNEIHKRGNWSWNGTSAQYATINDWNQKFTTAVRSTGGNNASRYLLYYGYMISPTIATDDYTNFRLPTDPASGKQIVGFHYYEPVEFSLQTTKPTWEDIPDARKDIASYFKAFKAKFIDNGIPVIIGENGPAAYANYSGNSGYNSANVETAHQNRLSFISYMYGEASKNGIVPIYWENGTYTAAYAEEGDFSLINRNNGQPNSTKSREVIERMIYAINNPPIAEITIGNWSYSISDESVQTGTIEQGTGANSNKLTFSGSVSYINEMFFIGSGFVILDAIPNSTELAKLKTAEYISFKVKGDGKKYEFGFPTGAGDYCSVQFEAPTSETLITIEIKEESWWCSDGREFNQNNVTGALWKADEFLAGEGPFSITVSDLTLTQ